MTKPYPKEFRAMTWWDGVNRLFTSVLDAGAYAKGGYDRAGASPGPARMATSGTAQVN